MNTKRKIILGSDWWTDCDDAVAIRLLARAHLAGEIELLGVCLNGCIPFSVASLDAYLNLHGLHLPIALDREASDFGGVPRFQESMRPYVTKQTRTNADAEEPVRFYRRLLAETDGKVEIAEIGFLQAITALLASPADDLSPLTGVELVREKVSCVWVMAGKWDEDPGSEHNFNNNPRARRAAAEFCRLCPVETVFLGWEVGVSVITGSHLAEDDPLRRLMVMHGSPSGRNSWDPMLAHLAVVGSPSLAGYRCVRGFASVSPETGENRFAPDEKGLHSYVVKLLDDAEYRSAIDARIASVPETRQM